MDIFQTIILSVVEGITEFLPISSTGHLVLTSKLLSIEQTDFVKTFEIAIQTGAILAVVLLYGRKILSNKDLLTKTFAAFIPTAIIGVLLYKLIKNFLIGNAEITLLALFIGGIAIIFLELYFKKGEKSNSQNQKSNIENLSYKQALLIGIFQSLSVVPGVSRAAATIIGGMLTGLDRKSAVEFSFILAIPTMLAATTLDLKESFGSFSMSEVQTLGIGSAVSFIVALIVVKWFLNYAQKYTFVPFGIYRVILAIGFYFFIIR